MSRFFTIGFLVSSLILVAPFNSTELLAPSLCAEDGVGCTTEVGTECTHKGVLWLDSRPI
jgi:hypothetical protein